MTHGNFVSAQTLDATFGAGSAARVRQLVANARLTPRKCPDDRYEMSQIQNASGSVSADACARCGGVWMPLTTIEAVARATPHTPDPSPSEERTRMALACVRSILAPPQPARR